MNKLVRTFLVAEAATLSILLILFLTSETYMHKFLEIVFGLPSSRDGVYGSFAKELTPNSSKFHDIQSITGDVLCLMLIVRALYKNQDDDPTNAALLAIFVDHGGFAWACFLQWGWMQPVFQGGALSAAALYLWFTNSATSMEEKSGEKKEKKT